eukprot:5645141-Amphidinium_carterae.1
MPAAAVPAVVRSAKCTGTARPPCLSCPGVRWPCANGWVCRACGHHGFPARTVMACNGVGVHACL